MHSRPHDSVARLPCRPFACADTSPKIQCDGQRPACAKCLAKGATCEYETASDETRFQALKRKYDTLSASSAAMSELFGMVRDRNEGTAKDIFRRIRTGEAPGLILQHVKAGDSLLQLSYMDTPPPSCSPNSVVARATPTSPT